MVYAEAAYELTQLLTKEAKWEIVQGRYGLEPAVRIASVVTRGNISIAAPVADGAKNDTFQLDRVRDLRKGLCLVITNLIPQGHVITGDAIEVVEITLIDGDTVTVKRGARAGNDPLVGLFHARAWANAAVYEAYCPVTSVRSASDLSSGIPVDFVTVSRMPGKGDVSTMDGPTGLSIQDIQVIAFSLDRSMVSHMIDVATLTLRNYMGIASDSGNEIQSCVLEDGGDIYEEESNYFGFGLTFCVGIAEG